MSDDSRDGGESHESLPGVHTESSAPASAAPGPKRKGKKKGRKNAKVKGRLAAKVATTNPPRPSAPPESSSPDADDVSIPPTSSESLDEHDERFFAEGEAASMKAAQLETLRVAGRGSTEERSTFEPFEPPPPHVAISPERRRKLANYVKIAVGVSAALCLAAVARVGLSKTEGTERAVATVSASPPPAEVAPPHAPEPLPASPPPAVPPPVVVAVAPVPTPSAPEPAVLPAPAPEAPAATESATALAPTPPAPSAAAAVPSDAPAKSAKQEKDDARRALEKGRSRDAVAAAQRSVALDPTDGDAWLLLGAAQQELGHAADAHASFASCVKQAKRGEIGECRAMLTWNGPR